MPSTDYNDEKKQNLSKKIALGKNEVIKTIEPGIIYCFPYNFIPCNDEAVTRFMLQVIEILERDL